MKKILFLLPVILLLTDCKSKKASLNDDDKIDAATFIDFYPSLQLPFEVADTGLFKKQSDSSRIGFKTFTQFVPDSVLTKDFGKKAKPALYAMGRATEKGKQTYLITKAILGRKKVAYLVCFSRDKKFLDAMPLVSSGFRSYSKAYGELDNKFQITTYRETRKRGGDRIYRKNVYFYNEEFNDLTLIMTESNGKNTGVVVNPIASLPEKHKYSGDYVKDKRNIVSVRDGRNAAEIVFFVHFEKNNGNCTGELKGKARFISKTVAQYYESGNPCTLQFYFTGTRVRMKETGGCGTYRDIKCFFDGTFPKKARKSKKKK